MPRSLAVCQEVCPRWRPFPTTSPGTSSPSQMKRLFTHSPSVQVKNRAARKGGLDISLFRRLSDAHPEAVIDLTHQYRMNSDIMLLSNKLIYSNRLKCGSDVVASQSLKLPNQKFLEFLHTKSTCRNAHCWMGQLMSERWVFSHSLSLIELEHPFTRHYPQLQRSVRRYGQRPSARLTGRGSGGKPDRGSFGTPGHRMSA